MTKLSEKIDQQIDAQIEKLKQLKAQKQAIESREKAKLKSQNRKDDTRRKILIGSCMLKLIKNDPVAKERLLSHLDRYLTEERDRKLFDL